MIRRARANQVGANQTDVNQADVNQTGVNRTGLNQASMIPLLAFACFVAALIGFGIASPDFSHTAHPIALLGAHREPRALMFNLAGFIVPGLLLAWQAIRLRSRLQHASWASRIALQLAMLSALGFLLQGLLPLEPNNLLASASRLHALAWTLQWLAFVASAALLAVTHGPGRVPGTVLATLALLAAFIGPALMPAGLAQRLACVLGFGWWLAISRSIPARPAKPARPRI